MVVWVITIVVRPSPDGCLEHGRTPLVVVDDAEQSQDSEN